MLKPHMTAYELQENGERNVECKSKAGNVSQPGVHCVRAGLTSVFQFEG